MKRQRHFLIAGLLLIAQIGALPFAPVARGIAQGLPERLSSQAGILENVLGILRAGR